MKRSQQTTLFPADDARPVSKAKKGETTEATEEDRYGCRIEEAVAFVLPIEAWGNLGGRGQRASGWRPRRDKPGGS